MSPTREGALRALLSSRRRSSRVSRSRVSSYFAESVLSLDKIEKYLPREVYRKVTHCVDVGEKLDKKMAAAVAVAVKTWAVEKGVTRYTHWFHPLSGLTAEKHDAFFDPEKRIEELRGDSLAQQEPDASSFPSGGIRSTFEARGYTVWDPSAPMFVWEDTLCIPTFFVAYTGEALDYRTPLVRSSRAVAEAAGQVARWFIKDFSFVRSLAGWEQEYFLVDRAFVQARQDILLTGRTLIGGASPRGQQLSDHYFGSIPARVLNYMKDLEVEAYKLGIPLKTRHNEVAPSQFEVAPLFEEVSRAVDHNQLLQHVMRRVANRHCLKALFHEKPFAGLNGSGKHCNWSLGTDTGVNLMDPSGDELLFLVFFVNTIQAVATHEALLRASVATYANDLRMGDHEAPPPIVSVYIGDHLQSVLDNLRNSDGKTGWSSWEKQCFMDSTMLLTIQLDNADRNRTSPFAFTGNRFEFRAPGAELNIARPITVLNTIVAQQLEQFHAAVLAHPAQERREAVVAVLKQYVASAAPIIFNGDGYAKEWHAEAKKRGLSNIKHTPQALAHYTSKPTVSLFEQQGVMQKKELEARRNADCDNYASKLTMEADVLHEMIGTQIIPAAVKQQNIFMENMVRNKELGLPCGHVMEAIRQISDHVGVLRENTTAMKGALARVERMEDPRERAAVLCREVKEKYFSRIRQSADILEGCIDDTFFPLVKYRELLFLR